MRRLLPFLLAVAAACGGGEQGIVLELGAPDETGDALCVTAFGEGERRFDRRYALDDLPAEGPATLAFVAGDEVNQQLRLTVRLDRGGRVVASAVGEEHFAGAPGKRISLTPRRCQERRMAGGTLQQMPLAQGLTARERLVAIDLDGDGRDELVTAGGTGVERVDPDQTPQVSTIALALPSSLDLATATLAGGDCVLGLVATGGGAPVLFRTPGAGAGTPLGWPAADAVAVGDLGGGGSIVAGGPDGLALLDPDAVIPAETISTDPFEAVVTEDLTGDGIDDIIARQAPAVAEGPSPARYFIGGMPAPVEAPDGLPPSFAMLTGPLAVGDLDHDGAPELVSAMGGDARIARNRGDGFLEDRTPATMPPRTADRIVRIVIADIDGDCTDELVLLDRTGDVAIYGADAALGFQLLAGAMNAADIAAADVNGDGARELVVLLRNGNLEMFAP